MVMVFFVEGLVTTVLEENCPSAQGKVKTKKPRHVMIRQLILLSFS